MVLRLLPFICALVTWVHGEISTVDHIPQVVSGELIGRLTSTTMLLNKPQCYFASQLPLSCMVGLCDIWLVIASGPGAATFDAEKTRADILSVAPYPSAFLGDNPKGFYITRLGPLWGFPCGPLPKVNYFRVGDEGNCTAINCNGILPPGSTIRAKYILVDLNTAGVVSDSKWSNPITLVSPMPSSAIDEGIEGLSKKMVAITVVTTCLMAVLLLLFVGVLIVDCSGVMKEQQNMPVRLKTYKNYFG